VCFRIKTSIATATAAATNMKKALNHQKLQRQPQQLPQQQQ
jgi:hypothetical protein